MIWGSHNHFSHDVMGAGNETGKTAQENREERCEYVLIMFAPLIVFL